MRGKAVIRTYISGRVVEKSKFWVPAQTRVRSGRVKGNTSAAKHDQNYRSAVKRAARDLNCNFGRGDLLITAKYDDDHLALIRSSTEDQDRLTRNFLRRLKRALGPLGKDLKAFIVPSEIDGETGRPVRPHVHIVLSGNGIVFADGAWRVGERTLSEIWGMGSIYGEPIRDQADLTPLALYMLRQARRVAGKPAYTHTRNLAKPIVTERVCKTGAPLKQPTGAVLVESGEYNVETGTHYIRYIAPQKGVAREKLQTESVPLPARQGAV